MTGAIRKWTDGLISARAATPSEVTQNLDPSGGVLWRSEGPYIRPLLLNQKPHLDSTMASNKDLVKWRTAEQATAKNNPIDSLTRQVEEFRIISQLESINRLDAENALLRQLLVAYRKQWSQVIDLLEQTQRALMILQRALEKCISDEVAAERDWLAYWGVKKDRELPKYEHPRVWI